MESMKAYVKRVSKKLKEHYYLHEYDLTLVFHKEPCKEHDGAENRGVVASINVDLMYLNITINIFPRFVEAYKEGGYDKCLEALTHEFAHVITEPLYKLAIDCQSNQTGKTLEEVRERQTQRVTNLVMIHLSRDKSFYPLK